MLWRSILTLIASFSLAACSGSSSGSGADGGAGQAAPTSQDVNLTLKQNSRVSADLTQVHATSLTVTQAPSHGVVTVRGTEVTYRLTEPLFNGVDSFKYKLLNGTAASAEATVQVTVTPLNTGTFTFTENYTGAAYDLTGWNSFSSSTGHTISSLTGFDTATYNSVLMPSRYFAMYGDNTVYAGDARFLSLFSVLPVDGGASPMKEWPWKAELIHLPECGVDATVVMKMVANSGINPIGSILLNYDIETAASGAKELTGYQILFNGGGGSLTLSRFNKANELATAYLDRWPNTNYGTEAMTNPVEYGPYKGWNYKNGNWPAGGNMGTGSNWNLAARYQYDSATQVTTISYEARQVNGTDLTPGVWDHVVVLSGADSLPTGGSFGVMGLNYHTASMMLNSDFELTEYKVSCDLP